MNFGDSITSHGEGDQEDLKREETQDDYCGPDSVDYYDYDALERLRELRSKQEFVLMKRVREGDDSARIDLVLHQMEDNELNERATETGFFWS